MTPVTALASRRPPVVKPREAPPAACTTAAQVRDRALAPVMDCHALAQYQHEKFETIRGRTSDSLILDALDDLETYAIAHRRKVEDAAAFLNACAESLEEAEAKRDWDGLTSQDLSCRDIARGLVSCLDPIADPAVDDSDARRALRTWFERYDRAKFRENAVAYGVGKRREPVLDREYAAWQRMQVTAS